MLITNSHAQADALSSVLIQQKIQRKLLQRWSDGNKEPGGMKILLNKLKAGECGRLGRIRCFSLHAAFMHYAHKHALFVFGAVNNHGPFKAALASASDAGRIGRKLTVCLV